MKISTKSHRNFSTLLSGYFHFLFSVKFSYTNILFPRFFFTRLSKFYVLNAHSVTFTSFVFLLFFFPFNERNRNCCSLKFFIEKVKSFIWKVSFFYLNIQNWYAIFYFLAFIPSKRMIKIILLFMFGKYIGSRPINKKFEMFFITILIFGFLV